jgi:hypothetical protein
MAPKVISEHPLGTFKFGVLWDIQKYKKDMLVF